MAKRDRVAKRVKDRWKAKRWYTLHAPPMFNRAVLGETPAEEEAQIQGRVIEVTVHDLTGDFGKMHIKVQFRVEGIAGTEVNTRYVGHDMTSDYIRRLTRRKRSRIDGTFDVKTKDGSVLRVKPMAITDRRIQNSKQAAIRKVMHRVVYEKAVKTALADFVQAMIIGDLAKDIATASKAIQPIFRVEIRKSELLRSSSVEPPGEGSPEVPEEQPPEGPPAEEPPVEPPAEEPELEEPAPTS
ncbi:MAG: 30S ribosomal protein S3ae [Thermoplasmata archaeon]